MNKLNLNLLVTIVARAMKEGFTISTYCNKIVIHNKENKYIELILISKGISVVNYDIYIMSDRGKNEIEDVSEEDVLRFKLLVKDCEKYENSKLIEDINNFFPKPDDKQTEVKNINDLDNEDD